MSVQTDRTTAELNYITAQYASAQSILRDFEYRANNPICGKPGFGFKAARKLRPTIANWQDIVADERISVNLWITRNGKASADERAKRLARVIELLPDFI